MSKKIIDSLKSFNLPSFAKKSELDVSPANGQNQPEGTPTGQKLSEAFPACLSFLSLTELSRWSEEITKTTATVYDKAMDKIYLRNGDGGGNHRMFDGGHDLAGAWKAAMNSSPDDTFQQEVIGYASSLWKDLTTVKGLPFITWEREGFNNCADWVTNTIPGASKEWVYDLMSYDAMEIIGASLGTAAVIFCLSESDKQRLSEILGAMSASSIASANPLMGVAIVLCVAYSYFIKKQQIDPKHAAVGASLAGISAGIFAVLGFPVLVELGICIAVTTLLRRHVIDNKQLLHFIKAKAAMVASPSAFTSFASQKL